MTLNLQNEEPQSGKIFILNKVLTIDLRSRLLTLGRIGASSIFRSLNRSLDNCRSRKSRKSREFGRTIERRRGWPFRWPLFLPLMEEEKGQHVETADTTR